MNAYLWKGTPFESFAANICSSNRHRLAFHIGAAEHTVSALFHGEEIVEARIVARMLVENAMSTNPDINNIFYVAGIAADWLKRKEGGMSQNSATQLADVEPTYEGLK